MSTHVISYFRYCALFILFCSCTAVSSGQSAGKNVRSTLTSASDSLKTADVQTIVRAGVRYVSVDDLARFFDAGTYVNTVLKKIELKLPAIRFKCTDESPFVVVTRPSDGSQNVYQLGAPVVFTGGAFIVPADEFLRMYEAQTQQKVFFAVHGPETGKTPARKSPVRNEVIIEPRDVSSSASEQLSVGTEDKAGKYSVTGIEVEEKKNGYLLRIHATERLPDAEAVLQGGEWLYVTVPRGRANVPQLSGTFATGLVRRVIPVQSVQSLQISFQLREKIQAVEIVQDRTGTDILIALHPATAAAVSNTPEMPAKPAEKKMPPQATTEPAEKKLPPQATTEPAEEKLPQEATTEPAEKKLPPQATTEPAEEKLPPQATTEPAAKKLPQATTEPAEKNMPPQATTEPAEEKLPQQATTEPAEKNIPSAAQTNAERQKSKWKLDVVVLDAGHGGHDPGTIGSMGTKEKDVTLGIALKLGALIEKNMRGVKVVYTRKTDNFVELYRRGQIANEAGGKLFISIHCNSTPKKSTQVNGFEIYLLRPGKTENAIEIAEQENAVVRLEKDFEHRYQKLTDENYIILTMAQSAYVKQSERFAEFLESEMAKKMVYQSRGVKQAGFYVLVGASMPNVLIETGYLSNKRDETLLRGLPGQYLAAQSIYDGLKRFKTEYERNFMDD